MDTPKGRPNCLHFVSDASYSVSLCGDKSVQRALSGARQRGNSLYAAIGSSAHICGRCTRSLALPTLQVLNRARSEYIDGPTMANGKYYDVTIWPCLHVSINAI